MCKDEGMVEKVNKALLLVGWRGLSLRGYGVWLASNAMQVRHEHRHIEHGGSSMPG